MLGRPVLVDPLTVDRQAVRPARCAPSEDLRGQVRQAPRSQLDASIAPAARRPGERPPGGRHRAGPGRPAAAGRRDRPRPGRVSRRPTCAPGGSAPLTGLARPARTRPLPRPLTFDPARRRSRARTSSSRTWSTRSSPRPPGCCAARIWGGRTPLHRIAAVRFTPPEGTVDRRVPGRGVRPAGGRRRRRRPAARGSHAGRARGARRPAGPAGWSWSSHGTPGCGMPWKPPSNRGAAGSPRRPSRQRRCGALAGARTAAGRRRCTRAGERLDGAVSGTSIAGGRTS